MKLIKFQPAPFTDGMTADGHEMTKRPYPIVADEHGEVQGEGMRENGVCRVVGLQKDSAVQQLDAWWPQVKADPTLAVGMYLVTANADGGFGTHMTAIESVQVIENWETH